MLTSRRDILLLLTLICASLQLSAQQYNAYQDRFSRYFLLSHDSIHHGAIAGLPASYYDSDSLPVFEPRARYSAGARKLYDDHLIQLRTKDLKVDIDLLLNFEVGQEQWEDNRYTDTTRMSRNMRGFMLQAELGDKVSVSTSFREFQSAVPWYLYRYGVRTGVMPGTGRIKPFNGTGFDHNIAEGYVAYAPNQHVNLQFGTQKNFIGSGYRSLLLSNHAYAYPQLKGLFSFAQNKVKYQVIHAWLQTLDRLPQGDTPESLFIRKTGSFKYLEFQPLPALSVGLFEAVIWDRYDPTKGVLAADPLMYSPVIGSSALALGLDDPQDNVVLGADLSARLIPELLLYGQYVLDEADQDGFQIGLRTINLGIEGLSLRAEYNSVQPFTFHSDIVRQGYHHFGEPIGHSMGAGFDELNLGLMYFYSRWFAHANYVQADRLFDRVGENDMLCSSGGDIHSMAECEVTGDLDYYTAQLRQFDLRVGYMFNPKSNFNTYLSWRYRDFRGAGFNQGHSLVAFGIEMSIFNQYEDF